MSTEFDREGLVSIFLSEAEDRVSRLLAGPPSCSWDADPEEISDQYIVAHTLKGTSSLYGYTGLSGLTEILETRVEKIYEMPQQRWPETVGMFRDLVARSYKFERIKEHGAEDAACCQDWTPDSRSHRPNSCRRSRRPLRQSIRRGTFRRYLRPELDSEVARISPPKPKSISRRLKPPSCAWKNIPMTPICCSNSFRTAAYIKGVGHTVGFKSIGDLIHHVEDFVAATREGERNDGGPDGRHVPRRRCGQIVDAA